VALLAGAGTVLVATIFAGAPAGDLNPFARFQHDRWGTGDRAVDERRAEDARAMGILGASYRWLEFPDAIYRGDLYLSDEDLFGAVKAGDAVVASAVATAIAALAAETLAPRVYLPLAVGGHVDHRICRAAASALPAEVFLYEDFPYAATPGAVDEAVQASGLSLTPELVDVTNAIDRRLAAIGAYPSQIPTIFRHYGPFEQVVREYAVQCAGTANRYVERTWGLDDSRS
jgi:LmbE family N-acetylglucosaminyl deacetylase